nr:GATA zinc finger domain-containing protein 14-like [Nomia melanderi]
MNVAEMKGTGILIIAVLFVHIHGVSLEKPEWLTALEKRREENALKKERLLSLILDLKNKGNPENNTYEQLIINLKNRGDENDPTNTDKRRLPPNLLSLLKNDENKNSDQPEKEPDQKNRRKRDSNKNNVINPDSSEENSSDDDSDESNNDKDNVIKESGRNNPGRNSHKKSSKKDKSSKKLNSDDDSNDSDSNEANNDNESRQKDSHRRNLGKDDTEEDNSSEEESRNSSKQNSKDKTKKWDWIRKHVEIQRKIQSKLAQNNNTDHWNVSISNFNLWHERKLNSAKQRILNICNISSEVGQENIRELIGKCKRDYAIAWKNTSLPWVIVKLKSLNDQYQISSTGNEKNWTNNSTVQRVLDTLNKLKVNNESLLTLLSQRQNQEEIIKALTSANESAVSANIGIDQGHGSRNIGGASVSISTSTDLGIPADKDIGKVGEEQQLEDTTSLSINKILTNDENNQANLNDLEGNTKPGNNETVELSQTDEKVAISGEPEAETLQSKTNSTDKPFESEKKNTDLISTIRPLFHQENKVNNASEIATTIESTEKVTTESNNIENNREYSVNNENKTLDLNVNGSAIGDKQIQQSVSKIDELIAENREQIGEHVNENVEINDINGANINNIDESSNDTYVRIDPNVKLVSVKVNDIEATSSQTESSTSENEKQTTSENQTVNDDGVDESTSTIRTQTEISYENNEIPNDTITNFENLEQPL